MNAKLVNAPVWEAVMRQGRHFLQIPGPSPVPDRVLRAMDMPVIDHRSAGFGELGRAVLEGSQRIFQTNGPVVIFPSSGTGAWEAAIVNMLPPGVGFNAISEKARAAAKTNRMPRSYFDWEEMLKPNAKGFFPYTPATNLLYGLREAIAMLLEEGLDKVFARHQRLAAATRAAVNHWGLEVLCQEPREYSPVLTAVLMPPGHDADQFRQVVLDNYNMSLGSGLSKLAGKVFRIGHLGECNELTLLGALTGVEMGLSLAGVPHRAGGVAAAMSFLEDRTQSNVAAHLKVISG